MKTPLVDSLDRVYARRFSEAEAKQEDEIWRAIVKVGHAYWDFVDHTAGTFSLKALDRQLEVRKHLTEGLATPAQWERRRPGDELSTKCGREETHLVATTASRSSRRWRGSPSCERCTASSN